jgi:hypothetical protein
MHEDDHEVGRRLADAYGKVGPPDPAAKERLMARLRGEVAARGEGAARREGGRRRPSIVAWSPGEWMMGAWGPAALWATAAVMLVVGGWLGWTLRDRWTPSPAPGAALERGLTEAPTTREVRLVQFVLAAPRASRVTVVGDFNDWDPEATPMVRRDGGAWTAAIPVSPGRHVYAFIVNGDRWVPDPAAPLAPEDGFGIRNSVIVVGGQEST